MNQQQVTFAYVGAFVDELARSGIHHVCIAPGSRSTPLALMIARHPELRVWLHLDERSAAFFALGMAKAGGQPVALLCTSGTAAANFYPAVIEARYGRVPLVVLTADRPPELREIGAPQTADQIRLYGEHVKWFVEMAVPEASPDLLRYARTVAGRAVSTAAAAPAGPVHLNFPLREPLVPLPVEPPLDWLDGQVTAWTGRPEGEPYVVASSALRVPDAGLIASLATELTSTPHGVIICGPNSDRSLAEPVTRLARLLGFPVLADPLSSVRSGEHDRSSVIDSYDAFLRDGRVVEALRPELVLRFGAMPTSKPVLLYLQQYPAARQIVVAGGDGWEDPTLLASRIVHSDPAMTCDLLVSALERHRIESDWLEPWTRIAERTRVAIEMTLTEMDMPFEGRAFAELARLLPAGSTVFASSSMPVRDLDTFFPSSERDIHFLSNRGVNGIDGVVSSALGAGAVSQGPLVLAIGDIALYHDMNGLLAAKLHHLDATIVLLNNDGGGIFSFLPQAGQPEYFEALFGTPHGLDFRPVAELYGASYSLSETWDDFRRAVERSLTTPGLKLIEMRTERDSNVVLHREIWRAVADALTPEVIACQRLS